jgi:hypothetical protein
MKEVAHRREQPAPGRAEVPPVLGVVVEGGALVEAHRHLVGFGGIVASETEALNLLVNMVWSGWTAVQRDNATEPSRHLPCPLPPRARRLA